MPKREGRREGGGSGRGGGGGGGEEKKDRDGNFLLFLLLPSSSSPFCTAPRPLSIFPFPNFINLQRKLTALARADIGSVFVRNTHLFC